MAYVRPCKKCGQRISLREMKAKQWVAFDASTEIPHRCGYKNTADPNIKKLAKEKFKEKDSEGIDLGYSDIATDNLSEEQADEINSEINDIYEEEEVKKNYLEKKLQEVKNSTIPLEKIQETEETVVQETKTYQNQTEDNKYKPRDIWWYVWRGIVIFWVIMFLNGILFGPFD